MTLRIRELIIRAEVSDSHPDTRDTFNEESVSPPTRRTGPESMADRFFDEDRQNENER